jgi:hypothetical protein
MDHAGEMRRGLATIEVAVGLVVLVGCGPRWVNITQASATDPEAMTLGVSVDACVTVPVPHVVETGTEVRIRIDARVDDSKSQKACAGGATVRLSRPIGTRSVVDEHSRRRLTVTFTPPVVSAPIAGSVAVARGHEGPATITGFVVVDADGNGQMCDELTSDGAACRSPSIDVDWTAGNATPPDALVTHGGVRASATPLTLSGALKDGTLYVGVS